MHEVISIIKKYQKGIKSDLEQWPFRNDEILAAD